LWRADNATYPPVWQSLGDNLPNPSVAAFAVNPIDSQRIVVGTGETNRYRGAGMFRTTDGGATWSSVQLGVNNPVPPEYFFRVRHALNNPQVMVAASDDGLWRSTDGGSTWPAKLAGHWTDLVLHPANANVMYAVQCGAGAGAGAGAGLYKSINQGADWTLQNTANLPAAASWERSTLAICRDFPNTLALTVVRGGNVGVYRTLNGGSTWTDVTSNLPGGFAGGYANHHQALTFHPANQDEIFLGSVDIARSYWDANANQLKWHVGVTAAGIEVGHPDITQLVFSPITGDNVLWIANDGGLYRHTFVNSVTTNWNGDSQTGLAISQIWYLDANRGMIAVGLQDNSVLRSFNAGQSWEILAGGDGGGVQITDPEHFDLWFWTFGDANVAYRLIFGQSQTEQLPMPPVPITTRMFHYDPRADRVWMATTQTIYSIAEAAPLNNFTWVAEIASGLHTNPNYQLLGIWGSKLESGTLFVTFGGNLGNDVAVTHKDGTNWVINLTTNLGPVYSVRPSSEWPGECWACVTTPTRPRIWHTTNYGKTWQDATGVFPAAVRTILTVVPTPFDPLTLYAGTDVGVFRTLDGGQTWQPFQTGLPIVAVSGLAFVVDDAHTSTHKLRAATFGRGTWERNIVTSPIVYVDATNTGSEDGTFEHPWNTVTKGINAAPPGAIVAIRSNTYFEPQVVSKAVTLMTYVGPTVIR
jgi:hypothetical protein